MSISIHMEATAEGGRYVATVDGLPGEAELTFTTRGPLLISADHTGAPESLRGTGAAKTLVEHMVAEAHSRGFKIIPICPYVMAQYRKHPEWRDVMTVDP